MKRDFDEVLQQASRWIELPGVSIVAQAEADDGRETILVHLTCKASELPEPLPATFHGYPVQIVEETDEVVPQR